ncbi:MAG: atpB [Candidatus Saccharibacteria bacterium]|nr:atpB [Candidatus Saccharibacteria bacterium]
MTNLYFAAAEPPHISLGPETLGHIGPLAITNSMVLGSIATTAMFAWLYFTARAIKRGSTSRNSTFLMMIFEYFHDLTVDVIGDKKIARKVLPLAITIFFFFLINNWVALFPFLNAVTWNGQSLVRGAAADLNMTLAVAVISIVTAQVWAFKRRGVMGALHRYFTNPFKDPLHFFIGILEIIGEISRTAALALRMFGNVFGGEVLLGVIAFLTSYGGIVALPVFYGLELFVGAVQAYVFYMLTIAFISLGLPEGKHPTADDPEPISDDHSKRPAVDAYAH